MKILMLTPYLPYPLLSGGQTRSYNLLKNLAKKHQITLFSLIKSEERKYVDELKNCCFEVCVFPRPETPWTIKNIVRTGFSWYPFLVIRNLSNTQRKAIIQKLHTDRFDLIHAETFYVMPHIPKTTIPILLVEQTIEYQVYQHFVDTFPILPARLLLYLDVLKLKYWEQFFWKKANKVVAMSTSDRGQMHKLLPTLDVDIVPNGVDIQSFRKIKRSNNFRPTILYVGNFKWLQNREAVHLLITDVWPKIKKAIPQAQLWIVGRGQQEKIENDAIILDQQVDDIRTVYSKADVMVAPIKGRGGTRLKILEAMASGCPVVTTSTGIEGIEATHGKEVLVAESSDDLAKNVINLIKNQTLRREIIQRAMNLVEKKYDWIAITKKLDQIYQEVSSK